MVYILHLNQKFGHSRHYVGYCGDDRFDERMKEHLSGNGSKFMARVKKKGINWQCVVKVPGATENLERRIKYIWKDTTKRCPICSKKPKKISGQHSITDLEMWDRYWMEKSPMF